MLTTYQDSNVQEKSMEKLFYEQTPNHALKQEIGEEK